MENKETILGFFLGIVSMIAIIVGQL